MIRPIVVGRTAERHRGELELHGIARDGDRRCSGSSPCPGRVPWRSARCPPPGRLPHRPPSHQGFGSSARRVFHRRSRAAVPGVRLARRGAGFADSPANGGGSSSRSAGSTARGADWHPIARMASAQEMRGTGRSERGGSARLGLFDLGPFRSMRLSLDLLGLPATRAAPSANRRGTLPPPLTRIGSTGPLIFT